jgi:hypothetical protein
VTALQKHLNAEGMEWKWTREMLPLLASSLDAAQGLQPPPKRAQARRQGITGGAEEKRKGLVAYAGPCAATILCSTTQGERAYYSGARMLCQPRVALDQRTRLWYYHCSTTTTFLPRVRESLTKGSPCGSKRFIAPLMRPIDYAAEN